MTAGSFRRRLMFGSLLWIAGLLAITTAIGITLIHRYPHLVGFVHNSALVVFATVCLVGGLSMVRHGLSPFTELRERLASVRDGRARRVDGHYPSEVQPVVDDLNALLDLRDQTVKRAIAKAGDLAHALKTPLAVLAHEAEVADGAGQGELAAVMRQQIERMRRQMDYHLAHARAAASGAAPGAHCSVLASAEGLARTLLRLHADRGLSIEVEADAAHVVRVEREDLDELVGNLLDNACKWARRSVTLNVGVSPETARTSTSARTRRGRRLSITVADDGPGLTDEQRARIGKRGLRLDETKPGSGLGLSIVMDLAQSYRGSCELARAPKGGLAVHLELPAA